MTFEEKNRMKIRGKSKNTKIIRDKEVEDRNNTITDKRDKKYHTRVNFEMTFDPQIRA